MEQLKWLVTVDCVEFTSNQRQGSWSQVLSDFIALDCVEIKLSLKENVCGFCSFVSLNIRWCVDELINDTEAGDSIKLSMFLCNGQ